MAEEKDIKPGWKNTNEKGKGGRPKKDIKATFSVSFRVTRREKKLITRRAKVAGLTSSEFCRRAALDKEIKEVISGERAEAYLTLKSFATDFARLRNAFAKGAPTLAEEIRQVIYRLNRELDIISDGFNGKSDKG